MCRCDFVMCVDKIFECLVVVNVWLVSWFSLLLQQNSLHSTSIEITLITIYRCCWSLPMLQSTFFFPFSHCSLSLSKLILSFTTFLSLDHSSHSLLFSFFSFSVWYVLDLKLFFLFLFFSISQGHHPLNRIKSVLWVFKVLSRRRCPWRVALAGNYLRQFWVFWGVRCNGFWYSVLSEIILGCSGGFDSKCFEQCGPIFG